jgi:hypothetical protein
VNPSYEAITELLENNLPEENLKVLLPYQWKTQNFIVTENVADKSLADYMMHDTEIKYADLLEIITQLICTLYILHKKHYFHCDAHSNNIMIKKNIGRRPVTFDCGKIGKFTLSPRYLALFIDLAACQTSRRNQSKHLSEGRCRDDVYLFFMGLLYLLVNLKNNKRLAKDPIEAVVEKINTTVYNLILESERPLWNDRKFHYFGNTLTKLLYSHIFSEHAIIKQPAPTKNVESPKNKRWEKFF